MQQRPQTIYVALGAVAIGIVALLLFAFLSRGADRGEGDLIGPTWQLAAITGETPAFQGVVPDEERSRYTITFADDGTFAARADCNALAGTFDLGRGDAITITPGPSTLVACPDGSYGSLFAHALGTVTTWAIAAGELTLTTEDGGTGTFVASSGGTPIGSASLPPSASPSPTASPTPTPSPSPSPTPTQSPTPSPTPTASPTPSASSAPTASPTVRPTATPAPTPTPTPAPTPTPTPAPTPPPGDDLVGTSWQLAAITTRDPVHQGVIPAAERSKYTASFAAGGRFSANADCNIVNGTWTATTGGGLSIVPGASTIVACPDGSISDLYILALTNSASYAIAGDGLTITLADGGTLAYEPSP